MHDLYNTYTFSVCQANLATLIFLRHPPLMLFGFGGISEQSSTGLVAVGLLVWENAIARALSAWGPQLPVLRLMPWLNVS